jgi:hypothetical protein
MKMEQALGIVAVVGFIGGCWRAVKYGNEDRLSYALFGACFAAALVFALS